MEYWQKLRQAVGHETLLLPSAACAVVRESKILLVRSTLSKTWHIPGGLHEPGETIKDTAQREIKEELGLTLEARDLISVYSGNKWLSEYPNGDSVQQFLFFFKMHGEFDFSEIQLQKSEVSEFCLVTADEVPENTMACCKQKILDYFSYQGQTFFR